MDVLRTPPLGGCANARPLRGSAPSEDTSAVVRSRKGSRLKLPQAVRSAEPLRRQECPEPMVRARGNDWGEGNLSPPGGNVCPARARPPNGLVSGCGPGAVPHPAQSCLRIAISTRECAKEGQSPSPEGNFGPSRGPVRAGQTFLPRPQLISMQHMEYAHRRLLSLHHYTTPPPPLHPPTCFLCPEVPG